MELVGVDCNNNTLITQADDNFAAATETFLANPTDIENCNAYRDAGQILITTILDHEPCFSVDNFEMLSAQVANLEIQLGNLNCM